MALKYPAMGFQDKETAANLAVIWMWLVFERNQEDLMQSTSLVLGRQTLSGRKPLLVKRVRSGTAASSRDQTASAN